MNMLVLSLFLAVQSFDAIPKDRQLYSVDLAREFYATPAAEVDERRAIDQELGELAARRGQLADSAEHLWQTIRTDEALLVRSRRYEAFMHLRAAVDTGDQAAIDAEREISEKDDEVEDDLRREFAAITPEAWARFVAKKSERKPYAWLIRSAATPCAGSANGCGTVPAALQAHIDGWQSDLRDLVAGGDSPQKRAVIAFALIHLASARNAEARLRGYPDAVTEADARRQWSRKSVAALIHVITVHPVLYTHFQDVRVPPAIQPQFTIDAARPVM